MKKFTVLFGMVIILSLILTACGGSGGSAGGASIKTTMTDFKFDPAQWTVPAGKQITLDLTNNGSVEHSWVLMSKPIAGPSFTDADKANVLFSKTVAAGGSETATFTAPATAGEYQVLCDIAGHYEAGMVGKLIVQ